MTPIEQAAKRFDKKAERVGEVMGTVCMCICLSWFIVPVYSAWGIYRAFRWAVITLQARRLAQ